MRYDKDKVLEACATIQKEYDDMQDKFRERFRKEMIEWMKSKEYHNLVNHTIR